MAFIKLARGHVDELFYKNRLEVKTVNRELRDGNGHDNRLSKTIIKPIVEKYQQSVSVKDHRPEKYNRSDHLPENIHLVRTGVVEETKHDG